MMRVLLGLSEAPPADAADALACAVTHLQRSAANALGLGAKPGPAPRSRSLGQASPPRAASKHPKS
jgi:hypothetical protein